MSMDVTLPNGVVVKGVPEGTSKEQIKDKAIRNGLATPEDFAMSGAVNQMPESLQGMAQTASAGFPMQGEQMPRPIGETLRSAGQGVVENLDIAGGLAGGLSGARYGAALGPKGALAGMVVGGGLGTFAGSAGSDVVQGEDPDYNKAVRSGLESMGIDLALLGAGRAVSPFKTTLLQKLGFTPSETADFVREGLQAQSIKEAPGVGTPESIRSTQDILNRGGATLTPYQTNEASRIATFNERVARLGLLSQFTIDRNLKNQTEAIRNELDSLTTSLYPSGRMDSAQLGESIYNTISEGKKALQASYAKSLDEISTQVTGKRVPTRPLQNSLKDFLSRGTREFGSIYDDATIKFVRDWENKLSRPGADISASDIFDFEKMLQRQITQLGDTNSPLYNTSAASDLANLSTNVRSAVLESLSDLGDDVVQQYTRLKSSYSEGYNSLLPKINKRFIDAAGKDDYKTLGNLLTTANNPSSINAMFKSIDEAYAQAQKTGQTLPFESANEAKNTIRASFIREKFPDLNNPEAFSITGTYSSLARELEKPSQVAKYRSVLGENWPTFKQLVNAMSEASRTPDSNLGSLVVRSKEYAAANAIFQVGGGAAIGGVPGAAIILGTPVFLAKIATSPAKTNKILAFNKRTFDTQDALETASENLVIDLFRDLPEEDQSEIREYIRTLTPAEAEQ